MEDSQIIYFANFLPTYSCSHTNLPYSCLCDQTRSQRDLHVASPQHRELTGITICMNINMKHVYSLYSCKKYLKRGA